MPSSMDSTLVALPYHGIAAHSGDIHHVVLLALAGPSLRAAGVLQRVLGFLGVPLVPAARLSAGRDHTAVITASGELVCFGANYDGQCKVPPGMGSVRAVSAGAFHTAAITSSGQLVCFGCNDDGQCDIPPELGPVSVVSAGAGHTAVVTELGELVCFGENAYGRCAVPAGLGPVKAVSAGLMHTAAIKASGELVCFGDNDYGRCSVPKGLGPVSMVSVGVGHTAAITESGKLVCFGENDDGQCKVPRKLGRVRAVAAGAAHTAAITADGKLVCFGDNSDGECNVPKRLGLVCAVAARTGNTVVITAAGKLVCFGSNACGKSTVPPWLGPLITVPVGNIDSQPEVRNGGHKPGDDVEYNSKSQGWIMATIIKFDEKKGTYDLNVRRNVKPDRIRAFPHQADIAVGSWVRLHSLNAAEHNGKEGRVAEWLESSCRWRVKFSDGTFLRVLPKNLHFMSDPEDLPMDFVVGNLWAARDTPFTRAWAARHSLRNDVAMGEIIQPVEHVEPPAYIPADEAARLVAGQEASFVELQHDPFVCESGRLCTPDSSISGNSEKLFLVQFKRCPAELPKALISGLALKSCRTALEAAGHQWKLPDGNLIFVHPWQYRAAMNASWPELRSFSVVFSEGLEYLVEESISNVGRGAVAKTRSILHTHCNSSDVAVFDAQEFNGTGSAGSSDSTEPCLVTIRTFLDYAPRLLDSTSVVQSSTEVHNGGLNPRRVDTS